MFPNIQIYFHTFSVVLLQLHFCIGCLNSGKEIVAHGTGRNHYKKKGETRSFTTLRPLTSGDLSPSRRHTDGGRIRNETQSNSDNLLDQGISTHFMKKGSLYNSYQARPKSCNQ